MNLALMAVFNYYMHLFSMSFREKNKSSLMTSYNAKTKRKKLEKKNNNLIPQVSQLCNYDLQSISIVTIRSSVSASCNFNTKNIHGACETNLTLSRATCHHAKVAPLSAKSVSCVLCRFFVLKIGSHSDRIT